MAPKRTSLRPNMKNRSSYVSAAWARLVTSRSHDGTLRRLKNGLLDVSQKSAGFLEKIKSNSESPLLCLPPEVRNRIWKYTLGGNTLNIVCFVSRKGRYIEEKTAVSAESFPEISHALLQVCRQIYTETALLPFLSNTFRFEREEAFDWAGHLLKVQQDLIESVHIVTHRAERMFGFVERRCSATRLPDAFPMDAFPNLKRVVVEIRRSVFHDTETGPKWTPKQYKINVTANIAKLTEHILNAKPDARVVIRHTNISEGCSTTGMTDSEDSGSDSE